MKYDLDSVNASFKAKTKARSTPTMSSRQDLDEIRIKHVISSQQRIAVSSALVAALVNLLPNDLGIVGKIFAVISSVGTVVLTASQWKKELAHVSELKSRWSALSFRLRAALG